MSLTALPVTMADLTQLQLGIQFFSNNAEATAEVALINAGTDTVSAYANKLLANNISLSQAAMAVDSLMYGATDTVAELTKLSTQFAPAQVTNALKNGFDPTVYSCEAIGLALAAGNGTSTAFATNFGSLSVSQFAAAVSTITGVNVNAIQTFAQNWINFYTKNGTIGGISVTLASYGAAFGDAVGVDLLNNPPGGAIQAAVANALFDNAQGTYKTGVPIFNLPTAAAFQGGTSLTFTLTPNVDSGAAFTTSGAGAIFNALPAAGVNTLNTGDNLQDSANDGTLNQTISATGTNPPLATGVTMKGLSKANITNATTATGGFQGDITGLLIENNQLSSSTVQIGAIGQGLKTLLTDINISGFSGTNGAVVNAAILAASLGDATKNINVGLTGNLGGTAAGAADKLVIGNDVGGGTTAAPNLTYGTMTLTAANTVNLQLQTGLTAGTGGVDGLKNIVVKGAGDVALGQDAAGNHQFLASYDSSGSTGAQFITGASAGNTSNFAGTGAAGANPAWLFGSAAGLLNDPGAGSFALTNVVLGSGLTVLDVSSATVANVAALKTAAGTGVTLNVNDEIIVNSTVADTTSATTFVNIKGSTTLGVGGAAVANNANGAGGTMNLANLPGFSTIIYQTAAQTAAANPVLTINNQTAALTVNVENNSAAANSIVVGAVGPASGINDNFTLVMGNNIQNATDTLGTAVAIALNVKGDEAITFNSQGGTSTGTNTLGYVQLTETVGGPEQVTITGDHNITIGTTTMGAIADVTAGGVLTINNLRIIDTDSGVTRLVGGDTGTPPLSFAATGDTGLGATHAYSTNAVFIDATASGGLIMQAGDGNVTDTIKGSANFGNVLGGSIGNDTFTSSVADVANTIYTDGGKDSIILVASHTASNHIGLYTGINNVAGGPIQPGQAELGQSGSMTSINDVPRIGTWASVFGGPAPTGHVAGVYDGLANGTGTSANETIVAGGANAFKPGTDVLDFAAGAWAIFGANHGLTAGNLVAGGIPIVALPGFVGAVSQTILPSVGIVAANSVNPGTDLILLDGVFTGGANQVAQTLILVTGNVHFAGALGVGEDAHMLVAYNDGSGNTNIADVDLFNNAGGPAQDTNLLSVHASDMVQLVGVSLASFSAAANTTVHFTATA